MAISRDRCAALMSSRLATLAQATNRTRIPAVMNASQTGSVILALYRSLIGMTLVRIPWFVSG